MGVAHPAWIDTDLVRDQQRDLDSFNRMLARLPGPFGSVTPVRECAAAFVEGIERRSRKVFVPRSLGPLAAVRQLFSSPLSDWVDGAERPAHHPPAGGRGPGAGPLLRRAQRGGGGAGGAPRRGGLAGGQRSAAAGAAGAKLARRTSRMRPPSIAPSTSS